jgi:hypothetical protein
MNRKMKRIQIQNAVRRYFSVLRVEGHMQYLKNYVKGHMERAHDGPLPSVRWKGEEGVEDEAR